MAEEAEKGLTPEAVKTAASAPFQVGDKVRSLGLGCAPADEVSVVEKDEKTGELFVPCSDGKHFLHEESGADFELVLDPGHRFDPRHYQRVASGADAAVAAVMSVLFSSTPIGWPSLSRCSAQRLAATTLAPERALWMSSPSQAPCRSSAAPISSRGAGNRVCRRSSARRPIASARGQP